MYRVYTSERDWRVEKIAYRVVAVHSRIQHPWHSYSSSVLAFPAARMLLLFFFQLAQGKANGLLFPAVSSRLARGTGRRWP